ncbi:MAG: hypothetical protein ACI4Q3_04370 [Kiritimatiellia bacterium]
MTSRPAVLVLLAGALAGPLAGAEGFLSVPAEVAACARHYRTALADRPQGVYEWKEKGVLFVQTRVSRLDADGESVDGLVLQARRQEIFRWLARQAAGMKKDEALPPARDWVRRQVRLFDPFWEYGEGWSGQLEGPSFSRDEGDERISCQVCGRAQVMALMPASFLASPPADVWLDGVREVVCANLLHRRNLTFLMRIGLLDVLELSRTNGLDLAVGAANAPAGGEFRAVRQARADYLRTSARADAFRRTRDALRRIPARTSFDYAIPSDVVSSNVVVSVTTNRAGTVSAATNVVERPAGEIVATMPQGGRVLERRVRTDDAIVTTTETVTLVRTRKVLVQKVQSGFFADPRFEELFLGGGELPNGPSPRTERGRQAERAFSAEGLPEDRRRVVLEALRENPGDKILWNLYGRLLQAEKDEQGALICFRNALRLDATYQYALTNLAVAYRNLGKTELARAAAFAAFGVASDAWCRTHAREILTK